MFKALRSDSNYSCVLDVNVDFNEPQLEAREDWYQPRDYLRPLVGGAVYGFCYAMVCSFLLTLLFDYPLMPALALICIVTVEMALLVPISAFIDHQTFLGRLRKYGPQFYRSETTLAMPKAESFELCLAATSELPNSKIIGVDEKKGTIVVSVKEVSWIDADWHVTIKIKPTGDSTSIISVDPSRKQTPYRRNLLNLVWGEKWTPLIFRSGRRDGEWNRKIINSFTEYLESVPNWDHRYDPHEMLEQVFAEKLCVKQSTEPLLRTDAA
jgi:hypothetical protein